MDGDDMKLVLGFDCSFQPAKESRPRVFVRIRESAWSDGVGIYYKKSLTFLKRMTVGFNFVEEDCNNTDALTVIQSITNFSECDPGVYEIVMCNKRHDREGGFLDDWDYELIPVKEQNEKASSVKDQGADKSNRTGRTGSPERPC